MVLASFFNTIAELEKKSLNCSYKSYARGDQGVSFWYFCVSVLFSKVTVGFFREPRQNECPKKFLFFFVWVFFVVFLLKSI